MPVIGFMSARSPEDTLQELNAFHKGLGEGGFIDIATRRSNIAGLAVTTRGCRHSQPNSCNSA